MNSSFGKSKITCDVLNLICSQNPQSTKQVCICRELTCRPQIVGVDAEEYHFINFYHLKNIKAKKISPDVPAFLFKEEVQL